MVIHSDPKRTLLKLNTLLNTNGTGIPITHISLLTMKKNDDRHNDPKS